MVKSRKSNTDAVRNKLSHKTLASKVCTITMRAGSTCVMTGRADDRVSDNLTDIQLFQRHITFSSQHLWKIKTDTFSTRVHKVDMKLAAPLALTESGLIVDYFSSLFILFIRMFLSNYAAWRLGWLGLCFYCTYNWRGTRIHDVHWRMEVICCLFCSCFAVTSTRWLSVLLPPWTQGV